MAVNVRRAAPGDLDLLVSLYAQLSPGNAATDRERAAAGLRQMLARSDISLLVAEIDGRPAGTVTLIVVPNVTHGARPWIQLENMVVDQSIRRGGVGRGLIDAAVALARETNAYKIQLQSAAHRREAHAFYESMGFEASSVGFRRYFEPSDPLDL